jgi:hypothetical protein
MVTRDGRIITGWFTLFLLKTPGQYMTGFISYFLFLLELLLNIWQNRVIIIKLVPLEHILLYV